jgi:hypothetical protein
MNMEITEHKSSKLEELSKEIRPLEDKDLDKSLGKIDEASSPFEKSNEISFTGSQETERDLASSKLQQELSSCGIYVSGQIYSDSLWGGIDSYSGNLVHNKINEARNANRITDAEYNKLIGMLKKACHHQ